MAQVEKNTNEALREKYFVDADNVLPVRRSARKPAQQSSKILDAAHVSVKGKRMLVRPDSAQTDKAIGVQVIREGDVVKKIRIACPCGRTAELDCEYSPNI